MRSHQYTMKLIRQYSNGMLHKKVAYEILGLQSGAHPREIKEAYLKLSKKFHPDVSSVMNATEMFKSVNEAYRLLNKETGEEEIFASGINKKPRYNFEDHVISDEDFEVFKKYTMNYTENKPEKSVFMRENNIKSKDFEDKSPKNRGRDQQTLKGRMASFLKQ